MLHTTAGGYRDRISLPWMARLPEPLWLLGLAGLAYVPLLFLGFGADIDSYDAVAAGERFLAGEGYLPSRPPGFPVHEVGSGLLNRTGGSVATNAGSMVMALLALYSFHRIGSRLRVPHLDVLVMLLALHPLFWGAASETMDYTWALGLGLAGGALLLDRRWLLAGMMFGLAIGARSTSLLFIGALMVFVFISFRSHRRDAVLTAAIALGLGALLYVPVLLYYWGSLDFLMPVGAEEAARWRFTDRLGRFVYKNAYAWGLPGALVLGGLLITAVIRSAGRSEGHRDVIFLALAVFLVYQALFLRFPFQVQYLLPVIPFVLFAAGVLLSRRWLMVSLAAVLLYNAFSLNLARPDDPTRAREAEVGLWLEPGYLVTQIAQRLQVRPCYDEACWRERSENGRFPEITSVGVSLIGSQRLTRVQTVGEDSDS